MTAALRIALVGNGPVGPGAAARIDAADRVVRFNNARGFGAQAGRRVDELFLVNVGGQALEWLDDPGFADRPHVAAAARISLPVASHGQRGRAALAAGAPLDGVNFEPELRDRLATPARPVRTMPDALRRAAVAALAGPGLWPSTGALALFWHDRTEPPGTRIELYGFGFKGASMHDWPRERAWAEARARRGRLAIASEAAA